MKLKVRSEEEEKEPITEVWLEEREGNVELKARCEKYCSSFILLVLKPNGKFYRAGCVPEELGFSLSTPKGQIIEQE